MAYVEEREFVLRFELRCTFPEDYQGDEDGYVWAARFREVAAELVQVAQGVVARHPGWRVRPGNRGRATEDEVTLVVERQLEPGR